MAGYDLEYTSIVDRRAQIRVGISTDRGDVSAFFVQLEYRHGDSWLEVVRFDHAPDAPMGHDVEVEGLHMDVYREGEKYRVEDAFPPVELNRAPRYCITYLQEHVDRLIRRFERWHNVNDPGR